MTPLLRLLLPKGIAGSARGRFLAFNRFLVDGPAYGGLVGSARDAARFMAVHLDGGEHDGVRLLSPKSVAAMQTLHACGRKLDVGLGWFRRGADRAGGRRLLGAPRRRRRLLVDDEGLSGPADRRGRDGERDRLRAQRRRRGGRRGLITA